MNLQFAIIHELKKDQAAQQGDKRLSTNLLNLDDKNIEFIIKLNDLFANHVYNYTHAIFDKEEKQVFPKKFKEFYDNQNQERFKKFTIEIMDKLVDEVKNTRAKGGYIVFAKYIISQKSIFSICMLRETNGFTFTEDKSNNINPTSVEHLDLDKLTMACQIDLNKYEINKEKYLKFTKNTKMSDVSDYFYKWIAIDFTSKSESKICNEKLIDIINNISLPIIEGNELSRDDFRKKSLEYINSRPDNLISLQSLGEHFYIDNPQSFFDYATENQIEIDTEFRKHPQTLKKLWKFDTEIDNIRLGFRYDDYRKGKIKLDPTDKSKITITSEKLVERIRAEIDEEENG
ncbi:MAG: hypothetical protein NT007_07975 [Candidatus Kapabacteria bacterium]|nr:hypothetical protein [Candidatus Kapabacteria bacterium]